MHGAAEPAPGIRATTAERKLVTVLFADIVNSSALVTGRDPEDADQALLSILDVLAGAIGRYGGTVAQMLGDGVLGVFGAPSALEDHALRACLTAQDIANTARADATGFQVRIGVATGEVVAHVIENGLWTDYRTVGESVHLAAKLQQRAAPNTVLIGRETAELVPVGLTVQPAASLQLAPGAPPFPVFQLIGVRAGRRTATDVVSAKAGPFVGRRRELEALRAALESAVDGVGTTVVLRGEAGIGKSRLVGELLRGCPHRLVHWPQAPIRRLGEPEDLEKVAATLATLGGSPDAAAMAAERAGGSLAGAAVREMLGLPVSDPVWPGLQPAERLPFAIDGLAMATVELAREEPVILLVEDVHWASPLMVRLLDTLAPLLEPARVLLLATSRTESGKGWTAEGHADALRLTLDALPSDKTQEFLDRWLGRHPSLGDLKALVAARSQGVPLYLEESLRVLENAGAIVGVPGDYRPGAAAAMIELPASVHGLLAARIDALGADARRTLLSAAVVGPTFDVGLLRGLAPVADAMLADRLADLEEAGLVTRTRLLPNLEYSFRHALIQEVAYGTIVKAERRALHARIVAALRGRREHDLPSRMDLLAHHAFKAEDWPAAYAYGRRAGERAEARSRLVDASQHYTNALTALERLEPTHRNNLRRIELSVALPRTLLPQGIANVEENLQSARELAESCGAPIWYARASSMLSSFRWTYAELDDAIRLCQEGLDALGDHQGFETRGQLLVRLGGILADKGYLQQAYDTLLEATALLTQSSFNRFGMAAAPVVTVHCVMARTLAELGRPVDAVQSGEAAVEAADESGHTFSKILANAHLGWTHLILNDFERGLPALETALTLSETTRSRLWRPLLLGGMGLVTVMRGDATHGLQLFDRSFEVFQRQSLRPNLPHPRAHLPQVEMWLAMALLHLERPDEAATAAERAARSARETGQLAHLAQADWVWSEALRATGASEQRAYASLQEAEELASRLQMRGLAARCAQSRSALRNRLSGTRVGA
ncbi:MAG TPA: AAA family ATPase [Azospirillum sp.]